LIPVYLLSADGNHVSVNKAGEVLVASGPYDLVVFNELAEPNVAYNYYTPDNKKQFVITGFLAYGDKQVGSVTNSTVVIYEASAPDTTTVDRVLIQFEVGQNQSIPLPNIRVLCNYGVYINAKCDDDDVHLTLFGHYVDLSGQGQTEN
jgi:hypothetical protein